MINQNISKETAELLLKISAISLRPHKPFQFTSGMKSPIYIDNRLVISHPEIRKQIIDFYVHFLRQEISLANVGLLSGTATAAIPHAAFISQRLDKPMIYVRDQQKGHGKENQIEGLLKSEQKTVVIEDHISTGSSLLENVQAVRAQGGQVDYAIATTTYQFPEAEEKFAKEKIKVFTLTDLGEIIEVAIKKKIIENGDRELVLSWSKDPHKWPKK